MLWRVWKGRGREKEIASLKQQPIPGYLIRKPRLYKIQLRQTRKKRFHPSLSNEVVM
jgi:hypothetical protein